MPKRKKTIPKTLGSEVRSIKKGGNLKQTKRKRWTPAEDLELKRYFSFGCYTSAEIAEKLGRKKSAVDARKNKLGLTRIKVSAKNPSDVAQIVKFRMAGWTQKEIGEVFGVTHSYISEILRQNGFVHFCKKYPKRKRYKNTWTEVELAILRKYLLRGYTAAEIQQEWLPHRSLHAIYQKRAEMTRHWPTPEQRAEREAFERESAAKQLKVDWDAPRKERTFGIHIH